METRSVEKRAEVARRDPFALLRRAMIDWFDEGREDAGLAGFSPRVDVKENGNALVVTAELPGVEEKDVEVSLNGDILTISGEKRHEKEEKGDEFYRVERSYGSFRRSFSLPTSVDADKVEASYKKGVLTVTLPKAAAAEKAKKIAVKAA